MEHGARDLRLNTSTRAIIIIGGRGRSLLDLHVTASRIWRADERISIVPSPAFVKQFLRVGSAS